MIYLQDNVKRKRFSFVSQHSMTVKKMPRMKTVGDSFLRGVEEEINKQQ